MIYTPPLPCDQLFSVCLAQPSITSLLGLSLHLFRGKHAESAPVFLFLCTGADIFFVIFFLLFGANEGFFRINAVGYIWPFSSLEPFKNISCVKSYNWILCFCINVSNVFSFFCFSLLLWPGAGLWKVISSLLEHTRRTASEIMGPLWRQFRHLASHIKGERTKCFVPSGILLADKFCQNMIRSEITNARTVPLLSALRPLPLHLFTVSKIMISVPFPPTSGWNPEPTLFPSNCPGNFLGGFLCVVPLTACYDLHKPAQHPNPKLSFHVGLQQMTHCGCYFMNYPTFICVLSRVTNSFVML